MSSEDLLGQLQAYALATKSPTVDMKLFLRTLPQERLGEVESRVKELAFKGAFTLDALDAQDGRPLSVSFPDFPVLALVDEYRKLVTDPVRPFPREETAPVTIPAEEILAIDARGQLGELFNAESLRSPLVIRLHFPEAVPSLIVPRACARTELIDAAVVRISRYLLDVKNTQYVESKLIVLLRGSELATRQALEDLTVRPRKAAATILAPTDFSFRFWSQLASVIVQDTGRKTAPTEVDTGILQSASIVTCAVFHMKGEAQREQERASDRRALEQQVRRAPFVFSYDDLYQMRDEKGAPYSLKHSRDFIHEFLNECLQKKEDDALPYLLRMYHAPTANDYFVQRDMLAPVFLKKLTDASDTLRVNYVRDWVDQMRRDRTPPITQSDGAFRKDLESRFQEFTVLAALANGPILLAVLRGTRLDEDIKRELSRCFTSRGVLKTPSALLGLSRVDLLREARSYLPFWRTAPVIRGIARFLRMLFRGRDEAREGAARLAQSEDRKRAAAVSLPGPISARAAGERLALQRYQKSLRALISSFVPPETKVEAALADLAEKWNPLLEPASKESLVRDVNALVQDFVRPIRRDFMAHPPDLARITSLAEELSASRSLAGIRNREPLVQYIRLYMARTLLG